MVALVNAEGHEIHVADTGAPIVLVTGLPGAGKSLAALAMFAVGQPNVWQANIPGCTLPQWDPLKWSELPEGGTIIIDEAQEVFPPKNPTSDPPDHYKLNRIRHGGRSIVLITQDPGMLDSRVRRLVGRHLHLVNVFGTDRAMIYDKQSGVMDIETRAGATSKMWEYPKEVFKLYKSTNLNRKQAAIPWKVKAIPILVVAAVLGIGGGVYYVWGQMGGDVPKEQQQSPGFMGSLKPRPAQPGASRAMSQEEYLAAASPRVAGLQFTAPKYDSVTKPDRAPYPAACVSSKTRCKCYSQDATALEMDDVTCRSIVDRGFFKDWSERGGQAQGAAPASTQPLRGNITETPRLSAQAQPVTVAQAEPPPQPAAVADGEALASVRCRGPRCMP